MGEECRGAGQNVVCWGGEGISVKGRLGKGGAYVPLA